MDVLYFAGAIYILIFYFNLIFVFVLLLAGEVRVGLLIYNYANERNSVDKAHL